MDRAYEGDETLQLARALGYLPVVRPTPIALPRGNMTAFYIVAAMKSNGSFAGSRLIGGCSRASTNWTFSLSASLSSSSFLKLYALVLTRPSIDRTRIIWDSAGSDAQPEATR